MAIEYGIAPFGPEILDAYSRLFPADPDKSDEILKWRFEANPHGRAMFAIAREGGVIQGMIALVPTKLCRGADVIAGFQAIDGIVSPDLRGRRVFASLGQVTEDCVAAAGGVLWGFPNAAAARTWFGRLGWTRTGTAPFLVRPLRTGYVLRRFMPALAGIDISLCRKARPAAVHAQPAIDQRYARIWAAQTPRTGWTVERTPEWVRWRLAKPSANYRWVFDECGRAFVATRTLRKHGGKITYVMEAMAGPDHLAELGRLLRSELSHAAHRCDSEVALAWAAPFSPYYRAHRAAGFLPFPDRHRPAEINHGYWPANDDADPAKAQERWHLSYLDSDTV